MPIAFFRRATVLAFLALSAASVGCSDDKASVDSSNGKAISDLDIGSDITLDKGQTMQVTATVEYADGTSLDVTKNGDLVWSIGNTNVATISETGVVTGVDIGTTNIKATYQGKKSAEHVIVVK